MNLIKPLFVIALILQLSSCASTSMKHVNATRFMLEAEEIRQIHTIQSSSFVGASKARAYIEKESLLTISGRPKTTVFWTELGGLPKEVSDIIEKGENPWPSALDGINRDSMVDPKELFKSL